MIVLGRFLLLAFSLPLLGGCNIALSNKLLFSPDQRSSTLVLEDGLWASVESNCPIDFTKPKEDWPGCAEWAVVQGNRIVEPQSDAQDIFMIDGAPPLIQGDDSNKQRKIYAFLGFKPTSLSPSGRIVALDMWPIPCGTFEEGSAKVRPFPGFNDECYAETIEAVRSAANHPAPVDQHVISWKRIRGN
jgi:hypothetical protein